MAPSTDRRRKLLREDTRAAEGGRTSLASTGSGKRRGRAYSPEAKADNQPRLSDYIPLRPYSLWLCFLGGCVAWGTVNALALARVEWWNNLPSTQSISFSGTGTLARWLGAMTLLASSLTAFFIYNFRRHKLDDYRGRYRIWWVLAVALILASIDAATDLHGTMAAGTGRLFASLRQYDPRAVWLTPWFAVGIFILARVWREVWASRLASLSVVAGMACYIAAAMLYVGSWRITHEVLRGMAILTTVQLGHHFIWMSLLLYLRQVFLHAQNALPVRGIKKRAVSKGLEERDEPQEETRSEARAARPDAEPRRVERDEDSEELLEDGASKADRRRLRKEHRHRRAA